MFSVRTHLKFRESNWFALDMKVSILELTFTKFGHNKIVLPLKAFVKKIQKVAKFERPESLSFLAAFTSVSVEALHTFDGI